MGRLLQVLACLLEATSGALISQFQNVEESLDAHK